MDGCSVAAAVVWLGLCTTGAFSTALPEGNFNTQNTTLAAAAHPSKAAQAPGQSLSVLGEGEICNMAGL
jgi:hypothetical protein